MDDFLRRPVASSPGRRILFVCACEQKRRPALGVRAGLEVVLSLSRRPFSIAWDGRLRCSNAMGVGRFLAERAGGKKGPSEVVDDGPPPERMVKCT